MSHVKFYTTLFFLMAGSLLIAQTITPIAFDFVTPVDVNLDADGNAWVTESGNGMALGKVTKVLSDGAKEVIIEGLPSHFDPMTNEIAGALSTQVMDDGTIYVCQGEGTDSLSGAIIEFHWDDYVSKGAPLTPADHRSAIKVSEWALANGYMESNPYSFVVDANGDFIISDAAANAVLKYAVSSNTFSTITSFPDFPNPLPFGPPMVNVVPTKILAHPDGGWLVSSLTGFPFAAGAAKIYHVQENGTINDYLTSLTLITDMAIDPNDNALTILQMANFGPIDTAGNLGFQFNSALVVKETAGGLDTVLTQFGPGAGLAIATDGSAYMTHLFLGQLLKSDPLPLNTEDIVLAQYKSASIYPNPNAGIFEVQINMENNSDLHFSIIDCNGRTVRTGNLGAFSAGTQILSFDTHELQCGLYQILLTGKEEVFTTRFVINIK